MAALAVAGQCPYKARGVSASRRLGMQDEQGGDAARTAGPGCPDVPDLVASCLVIKRGHLAGGCCLGTSWASVSCW